MKIYLSSKKIGTKMLKLTPFFGMNREANSSISTSFRKNAQQCVSTSFLISFIVFFQLACTSQTKSAEKNVLDSEMVPVPLPQTYQSSLAEAALPNSPQQTLQPLETSGSNRNSPNTLNSFYRSLSDSRKSSKPVNILHLGDSHTAGDKFSGRLRKRFQQRFGSAGRGMLPVGNVFPYFYPTNVKMLQSKGWKVSNSYKASGYPPYGLSGFRTKSDNPNHFITLKMTDGTRFDEVVLEFLRNRRTGSLQIQIDNLAPVTIETRDPTQHVDIEKIPIPNGGRRIKISPQGDGPIELLSWTFKRNRSGVMYHSHGIVGATINVMTRWSRKVVSWELDLLKPSLIIVAYGTNEGFHNDLEMGEYARDFRARLAFLQRAAPQASIVIAGPPDGNRLPRYCKQRKNVGCSSLTSYEIRNYEELLANQDERLCRWHPPPKLDAVRKTQRYVATQQGYFFWDWSTVMGGACGIHAWTKRNLAHQDHVHLKKQGYYQSAEALFRAIMARYQ
jgi:lysophospholipase L1-like esterase